MAQSSGPVAVGTNTERQFTDVLWRDLFGDEPGVVGDLDGTAYGLTLPPSSDIVSVGSATQLSLARVAGFSHRIPAGSPETITVPPAVGSPRTDLLTLRYDPAYTGSPGPVRLYRVPGTSATPPLYDAAPPGIEEMPLWTITRSPGQSLSQATVKRLFPRIAPTLELAFGAPLPASSPIGTVVKQQEYSFRRELNSQGVAAWVPERSLSISGRVPVTVTSSVNPDAGLTLVEVITPVPSDSWLHLVATGRTGFGAGAREIAWDFDSNAPGVIMTKDDPNTRISAPAAQFVTVTATAVLEVPANVAAKFRLVYRADGPGYNRGAVTWVRTFV